MKKYKDYTALSTVEDGDIQYGAHVSLIEKKENVYLNRMIRYGPPLVVLTYILFYLYVGFKNSRAGKCSIEYCGYCVLIFIR